MSDEPLFYNPSEVPWLRSALIKAVEILDSTPQRDWPSWYRDYRKGTMPVMGKPTLAELLAIRPE